MVRPVMVVAGVVLLCLGAALMRRGWRQRSWAWQCLACMGLFLGSWWTILGLFPGAANNASRLICPPGLALVIGPLFALRTRGTQRD